MSIAVEMEQRAALLGVTISPSAWSLCFHSCWYRTAEVALTCLSSSLRWLETIPLLKIVMTLPSLQRLVRALATCGYSQSVCLSIHFTLLFQFGASNGSLGNLSIHGPFGLALAASDCRVMHALVLFGVGSRRVCSCSAYQLPLRQVRS